MLKLVYQLMNLLEEENDKKIVKFLKKNSIEDILKTQTNESDDEYCLILQAIKFNSTILIKHLIEKNHCVKEYDFFG
jgi:hypothetical protein